MATAVSNLFIFRTEDEDPGDPGDPGAPGDPGDPGVVHPLGVTIPKNRDPGRIARDRELGQPMP